LRLIVFIPIIFQKAQSYEEQTVPFNMMSQCNGFIFTDLSVPQTVKNYDMSHPKCKKRWNLKYH